MREKNLYQRRKFFVHHIAEMVLKIVNTSNPNVRYTVGKDAESVLRKRAELSDMEMEKWVRESFLEKKGFMR